MTRKENDLPEGAVSGRMLSRYCLSHMRVWMRTALWLMLIGASASVLFPRMDQNALIDFGAYWSAAGLLVRGENPYDRDLLLQVERAIGWSITEPVIPWNPPWALSIIVPFALFPFRYASWAWILLNGALVIGLADYLWRSYGGTREYRMAAWLSALWFFPCIVALYFGQMSILVLAGVVGVAATANSESKWFGFFLLLMSLKPHLFLPFWIILGLWLLRRRSLKTIVGAAGAIALACLLTLCFRHEVFLDYYRAAFSADSPVIWATPTLGTALRLAFPGTGRWPVALPAVLGGVSALVLCKRWGKESRWDRRLNPVVLISLVTASYAWSFDWAVLLPSVIQVLVWIHLNPTKGWPFMAGLVTILFGYALANARGLFPVGVVWVPGSLLLLYEAARRWLAPPETSLEEPRSQLLDSMTHVATTR